MAYGLKVCSCHPLIKHISRMRKANLMEHKRYFKANLVILKIIENVVENIE